MLSAHFPVDSDVLIGTLVKRTSRTDIRKEEERMLLFSSPAHFQGGGVWMHWGWGGGGGGG